MTTTALASTSQNPTASSSGTPTQVSQINYGFSPETAPYAQQLLGQAQALTDVNQNPYQQYQGETTAQFSPLQQQAFTNIGNMQAAPQLQDASALAGMAGLNALNTNYTYNPYQTQSFTSPGMAQSYMNPYVMNVLNPQLALLNQQQGAAQQTANAQATNAGAFGGSRFGVQNAATNLNNQLAQQNTIGQGLYNAYAQGAQQFNTEQNASQAAANLNAQQGQFGANLGLQGLNTANQAATNLANIGNTQYQQNMAINQQQAQYGGVEQQQAQNMDNQAYQNFLNFQNYPYQQLNFMQNMIRGLPMTNQTSAIYQSPGSMLGQVAGLGIGAAAALKAEGGSVSSYKDGGTVGYAIGGDVTDPTEAEIYRMMDNMSDAQIQQMLQHPTSMAEQQAAQQQMSFRGTARMRDGGPVAFAKGGNEGEETSGGIGPYAYLAGAAPALYEMGKGILSKLPLSAFSGVPTAAGRTLGSGLTSWLGLAGETAAPAGAVGSAGLALSDLNTRYLKAHPEAREAMLGDIGSDAAFASAILNEADATKSKKDEYKATIGGGRGTTPTESYYGKALEDFNKKPTTPSGVKIPAPISDHPLYHEARAVATNAGHDAGDFDTSFDKILSKLSKGDEEHLKGINDLIASQLKEPERIKEEGKNQALMNFGFQMAAQAAQPGVAGNQGFAGLLRSAAAAGPEYAKSISDTDKMAADAKKLAIQLQVDQARYQTSLDKGNKRDAVQIYQNMQDNMMKQQQLQEMITHNRRTEGIQAAHYAAAGSNAELKKAQLSGLASSRAQKRVADEFKDINTAMTYKNQGITPAMLHKKYYNEEYGNVLASMTSGLSPLED